MKKARDSSSTLSSSPSSPSLSSLPWSSSVGRSRTSSATSATTSPKTHFGRTTGIDRLLVENAVLVVLLLVVMYTDGRWLRIPNAITYPTIVIGLAFGIIEGFPGALFVGGFVDHLAA